MTTSDDTRSGNDVGELIVQLPVTSPHKGMSRYKTTETATRTWVAEAVGFHDEVEKSGVVTDEQLAWGCIAEQAAEFGVGQSRQFRWRSTVQRFSTSQSWWQTVLWYSHKQGLSSKQLEIVFQSIIITHIAYAARAWSGFVSNEQEGKIDAWHSYCCGLTQNLLAFKQIAQRDYHTLFNSIKYATHCLNQLLPPNRNTQHTLRHICCQAVPLNCTKTPSWIGTCFVIMSPD